MPPTGTNWPAATFSRIRVEQLGVVLLHPGVLLRRRAREHEVRVGVHEGDARWRRSGRTCARSPAAATATPSRCARARRRTTWCALAAGGRVEQRRAATRARAGAEPATSSGSTVSSSRRRARTGCCARRVESAGSAFIRPTSAVRSCSSSHTATSRSATSTRRSTYCGSVPAVARSPYGVGTNPKLLAMFGLPAASTNTSTSGAVRPRHRLVQRRDALDRRPVRPPDQALGLEAGAVRVNPRSITSSTAVPAPGQPSGTCAGHVEPGGAPRRAPRETRRRPARSPGRPPRGTAPARRARSTRSGRAATRSR